MVMGKFGGWWAYYLGLYALLIPAINIFLMPVLSFLIHSKKLERTIWTKFLIVNGFVSIFASWWFWWIVSIENTNSGLALVWSGLASMLSIGYASQTIFFVIWTIFFFRKKELTNGFYKAWGWCFSLLYFVPNVIFLSWVAVGFLKPH